MDIENLHAFVTVADTGSFSRSADRLHLTQPAISKRIAVLENELNTRLFDRIGRRVLVTPAGRALLPRAYRILVEVEDTRRVMTRLSGGRIAGKLSIATSHHIGLHRLPPVLRSFTQHYPGVELDLNFVDSEQGCQAVLKGEMELAVVTLPVKPIPQLTASLIWHDPLAIVVGASHPLAKTKSLSLLQLLQHPAILPAHGTYTRQVLEDAITNLNTSNASLNVSMSTNYMETIKMMVSIGLGWSVLPLTMCDDNLHVINIDELSLERSLGIVRHTERTLSGAATKMIDTLKEHTA